jgi:alkanesulfonate monooxygenase SsuD/methylene tetrahydromethanopterin reductase-like flavin-dependent oxidoreductase (luciferase family)
MELCLTYDMRAPAFGAQRTRLYECALDQVSWADALGFDVVGLGEHHSADDGYNPSPLILASAMAARSKRIVLRTSVLLAPLYDLPKLAEDAAITQIISNGRLQLGIGAGYRPVEFETFGRKLGDRWAAMGEACEFLKLAWSGRAFEWQGRTLTISPRPEPCAPPILLGGSSPAAARRAAHIADGWFPPLDARLWQPYREECIALAKQDPGAYPQQGPIFLWVAHEPERAWNMVMPHVLHQLKSYTEWTIEAFGRPAGPYASAMTEENVRRSPAYRVLTPEQTVALAEELGPHSVLYLNPLLAGIDPAESLRMLRLFEDQVLPHLTALRH